MLVSPNTQSGVIQKRAEVRCVRRERSLRCEPKAWRIEGCSEPGVGASSRPSTEAAKGSDACGAPKQKETAATTARSGARREWNVERGDEADEDDIVSILRCGMYCFPNGRRLVGG